MQQNNTFKKIFRNICGGLIVLFAPSTLSTLHLASLYKSHNTTQKKKLSKKMFEIMKRFEQTDLTEQQQYGKMNNVDLFYKVYNHIDDLTINELNILNDFCYALEDRDSLVMTEPYELETEDDIYNKYSRIIDKYLDSKKLIKSKKEN